MTLFGRDSLLTSWMALPLDPGLARRHAADAGAAPGHSATTPPRRRSPGASCTRCASAPSRRSRSVASRSTTAPSTRRRCSSCCSASCAGGAWTRRRSTGCCRTPTARWSGSVDCGDRDGDGFVEYQRATDRGLANQGWKDSWDGVTLRRRHGGPWRRSRSARCRATSTPRSWLARSSRPQPATPRPSELWAGRAARLKEAFNARFWLPDQGCFALALDGDKRPVDALASNMGHCLWTGIVDEDKARGGRRAAAVARDVHRLGRPDARPARWAPTTRSATTTARCGRTTTR